MSRATRIALPLAVLVLAVVLFVVLKPSDDGEKTTTQTATTATTPGGTKSNPTPPPSPPIANIEIKDGKPIGGIRELAFGKGQTVQVRVESDTADEVHVHGYDLMKDVSPGHPVKFEFEGDEEGQFEVELEGSAVQIASLKVTP